MSLQPNLTNHHPHRGSDIEAYIKHWRDTSDKSSPTWLRFDQMLDDYRLRTDYGRGLADSTEGLE